MAEGARLESVYTGNCIEGSNPSPSAIIWLALVSLRSTTPTGRGTIAGPQSPPWAEFEVCSSVFAPPLMRITIRQEKSGTR